VLGSKYDSRLHFTFGSAGHYVYEVNYKFSVGMRDDGQIGVGSFCYFFRYFNVELIGLLRLIWHNKNLPKGRQIKKILSLDNQEEYLFICAFLNLI